MKPKDSSDPFVLLLELVGFEVHSCTMAAVGVMSMMVGIYLACVNTATE